MKAFGLSASERIRSKKDFERIFTKGRVIYSSENILRVHFDKRKAEGKIRPDVRFAAAVSKKLGTAVWRNRVKRLIRESFRLNKAELIDYCKMKSLELDVIISPQNLNEENYKRIRLLYIEPLVKELILKIKNNI